MKQNNYRYSFRLMFPFWVQMSTKKGLKVFDIWSVCLRTGLRENGWTNNFKISINSFCCQPTSFISALSLMLKDFFNYLTWYLMSFGKSQNYPKRCTYFVEIWYFSRTANTIHLKGTVSKYFFKILFFLRFPIYGAVSPKNKLI